MMQKYGTMKCAWDSAPSTTMPSESSGRRYIPSKAKLRQMAKDSSVGGRFICPICHEGFSVSYSVFGHIRSFQEDTYYCRDCAKNTVVKG